MLSRNVDNLSPCVVIKKRLNIFSNWICSTQFHYVLLIIGAALRLQHYFENRSLWLDEAWLALGLNTASLHSIFNQQPLFSDMPLPPAGFLLLEKSFIIMLGSSEFVLRLLPLVAGLTLLALFYKLCRFCLNSAATTIALAIIAFNEPLIYYSAEVKQYSSDTCIATILMLFYCKYITQNRTVKDSLWFGLCGVLAFYCSHTAIFVLGGISLALSFFDFFIKRKKQLFYVWPCLIWFIAGMAYSQSQAMQAMQHFTIQTGAQSHNYIAPSGASVLASTGWLIDKLATIYPTILALYPAWLWFFVFIIGILHLWEKTNRLTMVLVGSMGVMMIAIITRRYFFGDRFVLFLIPSVAIFIAAGFDVIMKKSRGWKYATAIILSSLLFYKPLTTSLYYLKNGREKEDIRSVMAEFSRQYNNEDALYMNVASQYGLGFYNAKYKVLNVYKTAGVIYFLNEDLCSKVLIKLKKFFFNQNGYIVEVEPVLAPPYPTTANHQKRSWFILSHLQSQQRKRLLDLLEESGYKRMQYITKGAELYLYDFSKQPESKGQN